MKIYFEKNITSISGKDLAENVIYSSLREGNICYARKYVYPTLTPNNERFGENGTNLRNLWSQATTAYKNDLRTYATRENQGQYWETKKANYSWFCKIIYAYAKSEGTDVSLIQITDLRTSAIKDVKGAIDNGFLKQVPDYAELDSTI